MVGVGVGGCYVEKRKLDPKEGERGGGLPDSLRPVIMGTNGIAITKASKKECVEIYV